MAATNGYSHVKDVLLNRFLTIVFLIIFALGAWMIVRSASSQTLTCRQGDSTETCVALLNQKALQLDQHADNTDKNVASINENLTKVNSTLTQLVNNEAWERAIWGFIVVLISSGFFAVQFRRKKAHEGDTQELRL